MDEIFVISVCFYYLFFVIIMYLCLAFLQVSELMMTMLLQ
jgi:hypothetical protein